MTRLGPLEILKQGQIESSPFCNELLAVFPNLIECIGIIKNILPQLPVHLALESLDFVVPLYANHFRVLRQKH